MRRYAAKIDDNQPGIVKYLRRFGASVQPIHTLGGGMPDLLVGYGGRNFLLEVKDGAKPPSKRLLTIAEGEWRQAWAGQYAVVCSTDDCLSVLGINISSDTFELTAQAAREVC